MSQHGRGGGSLQAEGRKRLVSQRRIVTALAQEGAVGQSRAVLQEARTCAGSELSVLGHEVIPERNLFHPVWIYVECPGGAHLA